MFLGRRGSVAGTDLLIEPASDWIIRKVESKHTGKKTAQERDWVLSELFENWRQFIYEHTESPNRCPGNCGLWDSSAFLGGVGGSGNIHFSESQPAGPASTK